MKRKEGERHLQLHKSWGLADMFIYILAQTSIHPSFPEFLYMFKSRALFFQPYSGSGSFVLWYGWTLLSLLYATYGRGMTSISIRREKHWYFFQMPIFSRHKKNDCVLVTLILVSPCKEYVFIVENFQKRKKPSLIILRDSLLWKNVIIHPRL